MKIPTTALTLCMMLCLPTGVVATERVECSSKGLGWLISAPEPGDLGLTEIRAGRLPDIGRGPGIVLHFNRGLNGFGVQINDPELVVTVGDWRRSCRIVLPQAACPPAADSYAKLSRVNLPIGFAFDHPQAITVMHGTIYSLAAVDGQGNDIYWSYHGPGHPAQAEIDSVLVSVDSCAAPAYRAFKQAGL